ncbi:hypothetical protein ACFRFH_18975 [Leifsonia sp. NPDC056824]|uniref:hypothetical protein n=1 Tax=Leifsonia sp. NPDC056824 TaxID=3345953 RepID=UPI0036A69D98
MTATGPVFDPARSAALRDILHETVANAPARPARLRFALVAGLVGAAALLAGGTAALAISGVLHFGSPEPAPAPAPTPSSTSTPTPTATPTPTPSTLPIAVQTTPIERHDVNELAAAPWSVDLPGTGRSCEQHHVYDVADGLALVQLGANVVGDGSPDCQDDLQHVAVSLVDTKHGTVLWSREWTWHAQPLYDVDVIVLGTSGRVLVADAALGGGPHDVLDLVTGATVGNFAGTVNDRLIDVVPVPGDSGDIIMSTGKTIVRADPRDVSSTRWSTPAPGKSAYVFPFGGGANFAPVSIANSPDSAGNPYDFARIDATTGRLDSGWNDSSLIQGASTRVAMSGYDSVGHPSLLTGLDPSGGSIWTKQLPPTAYVVPVHAMDGVAGADVTYPTASDLLAVLSGSDFTVVDAASGTTRWSASAARCGLDSSRPMPLTEVVLDAAHDDLIVVIGTTKTCTFAASTGAPHPLPDVPSGTGTGLLFGPANTYAVAPQSNESTITAFDRQSGAELWRMNYPGGAYFAGGYLVTLTGHRLTGLG